MNLPKFQKLEPKMPGAIVKSPFQYDLPSEAYHIRLLNNCRKHAEEDPEKYAFVSFFSKYFFYELYNSLISKGTER